MSEETLFHEALAKAHGERAAFLDAACAGQPDLRAAVEALLAAHAASDVLLDPPAGDPQATGVYTPGTGASSLQQRLAPGAAFAGRFKLREKLGEGGMGSVWVADQTEPVQRRVALKVIKAGLDSGRLLARFEQERQALALMDHPHIAKVFDAGVADGHPYFVMELIKGVPLTKYCDEAKLTPKERLELFIPVCQAVQHAHQKGIIHRDLKPSNIIVGLYDGRPVPKVIDFGVAKATGPQLTEQSIYTEIGALIGTLEYMSPEQAELNNLDIDTRSDIYALGVILYELFTGSVPFSRKELQSAALEEMLRIIKEVEPPRPSTKISTLEKLASVAAVRRTEPQKLSALIQGDLDWIVMKCLEKQRSRRYETANALAMDIQRYLADEPVLAGPPTVGYRLRKFVQRHKGPVLAATAVLFLLVAGIAGTTTGLLWAVNAKAVAQENEQKAQAAQRAETQAREAEASQRRQAEAVADLLESAFRGLDAGNTGLDFEAALTERLRDVAAKLDRDYAGEPLVRARLRHILGGTHKGLGDPGRALGLLRQAVEEYRTLLGPDHLQTLVCLNSLGAAYQDLGQLAQAEQVQEDVLARMRLHHRQDLAAVSRSMSLLALLHEARGDCEKALPLYKEALALHQAQRGPDHQDSLAMLSNLGLAHLHAGQTAQGLELLERAVARCHALLGPNHPATLSSLNNLATGYYDAGHFDQAVAQSKLVLQRYLDKHGAQHPQVLLAKNNLAVALKEAGQLDAALKLLEEVVQGRQARLGLEHPNTLIALNNLADARLHAGQVARAVPMLEDTWAKQKRVLGPDHPATLFTMTNLGRAYRDANQLAKALPLLTDALERRRTHLGPDHPNTLAGMTILGSAYHKNGQFAQAIVLLEQALEQQRRKLGPEQPDTLITQHELGVTCWRADKFDRAIPLFQELAAIQQRKLGADHPETLKVKANLGVNYRDAGRTAEAIAVLEEVVAKARSLPADADKEGLAWVFPKLAEAYMQAEQHAKAEPLLRELVEMAKRRHGEDHRATAAALARLGSNLLLQSKHSEAETVLRSCLAFCQKHMADEAHTFHVQAKLGAALLGQRKHAEAEPHLREGYEGMKQRLERIPPEGRPRLLDVLEKLIQLHEAPGRKEEAAKWRQERETMKRKMEPATR